MYQVYGSELGRAKECQNQPGYARGKQRYFLIRPTAYAEAGKVGSALGRGASNDAEIGKARCVPIRGVAD